MIRALVIFLPFVLYALFLLVMKRDLKERTNWPYKRVLLLTIVGVILAIISFTAMLSEGGFGEYRPATFENGVFKPAERVK